MKDTVFNILKYKVSLFYSNKWIRLIYMNEDCVKMQFSYVESRCLTAVVHVKTSVQSCNNLLKKTKLGNAVNFATLTHCLRAHITSHLQLLQSLWPCWLQHLQTWSIMWASVSRGRETNFNTSVTQLSPHLTRYALAKFRLHWSITVSQLLLQGLQVNRSAPE